jgi:adenylylsulfate kinase
MGVKAIVISGSMGSGKTTVLGEMSDILADHGVQHAAIDLDAIGSVLFPDAAAKPLSLRNLASVSGNFVDAGITRILLAEAVESRDHFAQLQQALSGADLVLCRLTADIETMQRRLRTREPGMYQERFVARAKTLDAALDAAKVEDFTVRNDARPITDVAREVLLRSGWIV